MDNPFNQEYWDQRYQKSETGWDLGTVSPPIKAYVDHITNKHTRILIPGCGNAYEAGYLLEQGFADITLIDISPSLTAAIEKRLAAYPGKNLQVITGDFFNLKDQFDLILEQTFFCALSPELRKDYVQQMHRLLKSEGILAGVLFNRHFEGGPPFGGSLQEYEKLFAPYFHILQMEPCENSAAPRAGTELFIELKKRN